MSNTSLTHICIIKLTIISSNNSLSSVWHQAIIWTNAGLFIVNWTLGNKLQWNLHQVYLISLKKMHLKLLSRNWRSFCHSFNVLMCGCGISMRTFRITHKTSCPYNGRYDFYTTWEIWKALTFKILKVFFIWSPEVRRLTFASNTYLSIYGQDILREISKGTNEIPQNILPIHWKICFLHDVGIIRALRF